MGAIENIASSTYKLLGCTSTLADQNDAIHGASEDRRFGDRKERRRIDDDVLKPLPELGKKRFHRFRAKQLSRVGRDGSRRNEPQVGLLPVLLNDVVDTVVPS